MPAELMQKMMDPREAVVLHHTHPDNTALSPQDIYFLALPGGHAIWAHGHGGAVSRAALTEAARKAIAADPVGGAGQIFALSNETVKRIERVVQRAIDDGRISLNEADGMLTHLVDVMMHDAGIINYASNLDAAPLIAKLNFAGYLKVVAASIRSKFYGNRAHAISDDRAAEGFRHPGDLGATFAQADAAATKHNAARPDDP
jgi:hypothetical protein